VKLKQEHCNRNSRFSRQSRHVKQVLPPSELIHKFSAQTREDAIADKVSREFTDFTYNLRIKISTFLQNVLIHRISTADLSVPFSDPCRI